MIDEFSEINGEAGTMRVGRFCAFADGAVMLLGGEHRDDWISTYPFALLQPGVLPGLGHPANNGDVTVGSDVWVLQEAMILSGVKIGRGAGVAARSVVTYANVGGNPVRIIRYRICVAMIEIRLMLAWWEWPKGRIRASLSMIMSNHGAAFVARTPCAEME